MSKYAWLDTIGEPCGEEEIIGKIGKEVDKVKRYKFHTFILQ